MPRTAKMAAELIRIALAHNSDECLIRKRAPAGGGYTQTYVDGRYQSTHRFIYRAIIGPIPRGKQLLHSCDNPPCFNPRHLRPGTQAENMQDMRDRGRARYARGERSRSAKMTVVKVRKIRSALKRGDGQDALALRYGVTQSAISRVASRKSWSHA